MAIVTEVLEAAEELFQRRAARTSYRGLASEHGPVAISELARLATEAQSESARVQACGMIIDRAYGKAIPSRPIETTPEREEKKPDPRQQKLEEQRRKAAEAIARKAAERARKEEEKARKEQLKREREIQKAEQALKDAERRLAALKR